MVRYKYYKADILNDLYCLFDAEIIKKYEKWIDDAIWYFYDDEASQLFASKEIEDFINKNVEEDEYKIEEEKYQQEKASGRAKIKVGEQK